MTAQAPNVLRLNAVELLRHPGTTRVVEADLSPGELGIDDDRIDPPVRVALTATSSVDGIVVHGTVTAVWHDRCRRCLVDVSGESVSQVDELFQDEPTDDEAVEIVGDQIELAPVVREYVLLDLPDGPLCREDCAGICPQCGADRNVTSCTCDEAPRDIRWSALEGLELEE